MPIYMCLLTITCLHNKAALTEMLVKFILFIYLQGLNLVDLLENVLFVYAWM